MVDKRRYNAKLNAKGLEKVLTEEQAGAFCRNQGNGGIFIVQAHAGPKVVDEDGSETVNMVMDLVEFVPESHAERVREFQRALYLNRPEGFGQGAFEEATSGEPSLDTAAAQLDAAVERDEKGDPTGVWDGDPDSPVTEKDGAAEVKVTKPAKKASAVSAVPDLPEGVDDGGVVDECPHPGCSYPVEHEGDHEDQAESDAK